MTQSQFNCAYTKLVPLSEIVRNPRNPNKHTEGQIKRLSEIIAFNGQRSPIVISTRSGFITKGHARLDAITLLGWDKAAVDYQDYENEAKEYTDIVADNEIARWAELDWELHLSNSVELDLDKTDDMFGLFNVEYDKLVLDEEPQTTKDTEESYAVKIEFDTYEEYSGFKSSLDLLKDKVDFVDIKQYFVK